MFTLFSDGSESGVPVPLVSNAATSIHFGVQRFVPIALRYRAEIAAKTAISADIRPPIVPANASSDLRGVPASTADASSLRTGSALLHCIMSLQC
jgi:hypothetical protein